jgi:anti-anti-sigma regulatory factor
MSHPSSRLEERVMPDTPVLKVAGTSGGYCLRVEGRGTMRESASALEFVAAPLAQPGVGVVVDLSACDHLDSTFLGCLIEMQRRAGRANPPRFVVSAPPEKVKKLLSPTKLDLVLKTTAEPARVTGDWVALAGAEAGSPDVMRHVMECHRLLAETGAPQKAAFAAIADGIERELRAKAAGPKA